MWRPFVLASGWATARWLARRADLATRSIAERRRVAQRTARDRIYPKALGGQPRAAAAQELFAHLLLSAWARVAVRVGAQIQETASRWDVAAGKLRASALLSMRRLAREYARWRIALRARDLGGARSRDTAQYASTAVNAAELVWPQGGTRRVEYAEVASPRSRSQPVSERAPAYERMPHAPASPALAFGSLVFVGVIVALSALTYSAVTRNWKGFPQVTPAQRGFPVVRPSATPTLATPQPAYLVGAWVSDSAPQPSSIVTVYIRITDSATSAPVVGVPVRLTARLTCKASGAAQAYGPANTGTDGVAAVAVAFSGLPVGEPVCVTAQADIGGQTYAADTTFTAAAEAPPTATPLTPDASAPTSPAPTPTWKRKP
jgi:hypothetical protein